MVQEGLEKSPIQPSTLHARLKAKGIVKGGISTLTSRKIIINNYSFASITTMKMVNES